MADLTQDEQLICSRIKALRNQLRMKQIDFGDRINVAQGYYSSIENGKRPATEKIIKLICLQTWKSKRVNEIWLRTGEGDMFIEPLEISETAKIVSLLLENKDNPFYIIIEEIMRSYEHLDSSSRAALTQYASLILENIKKR